MNEPDRLDSLLQEWQPSPSAQPDFAQEVHARLEAASTSSVGRFFRFPVALPLAASLAVVAGTVAGISVNNHHDEQRMADAYARSIDPVRMVIHSHP